MLKVEKSIFGLIIASVLPFCESVLSQDEFPKVSAIQAERKGDAKLDGINQKTAALIMQGLSEDERIKAELKRADDELNSTYQEVMAFLKKEQKNPELGESGYGSRESYKSLMESLRKAQRTWVEFKTADSDLAYTETIAAGGHGGIGIANQRELELTLERIKFLKCFLSE